MKKTPFALVALLALAAQADVSVSKIFGSNMVLQRDRPVPVWGKAAPGEEVCVSFAGQNLSAKADDAGEWQVELKPLKLSKDGAELVIVGPTSTNVFKNVLVGDVWLCSGQSNMEMSFSWGIYEGDKFKAESGQYPTIRRMKIRKCTKPAPEPYDVPVDQNWAVASNAFPHITATGYFFARKLTQELDIPIGLIDDSWSGCKIEPFISGEGFHLVPALRETADKLDEQDPKTEAGKAALTKVIADTRKWADDAEAALAKGQKPTSQPPQMSIIGGVTGQYNWMIAPIVRFPIKGAIWYQGCSNGGEGDEYIDKTEALVLGWRKAWGYDFPFYWVQLASFTAFTDDPAGGNGYARIRDAQRKAINRIPKTGMAVAIDVGNPGDIHPKAKLFVGERLALWALAKDYGKDIVCSGPLVKTVVAEPAGLDADIAKVRVSFDYTGSGLMAGKKDWKTNDPVEEDAEAAGKIKGFALQGVDGKWYWATAVIDGKDVVLSAPEVKEPIAVRYAYRANPLGKCSLYNKEGLPASPFSIQIPRPAQDAAPDAAP